jgi:hypothetical protein
LGNKEEKENKQYMQLQTEFSKMQFLLTGNRFSGVNLTKTRLDFDVQKSTKLEGISFTIVFSTEIDYMEVEDKIKYLQHATIDIDFKTLKTDALPFLKSVTTQLQDELLRRYHTSNVFKLLELPVADKIKDEDLNNRILRIITDTNNGIK